jgi:hypothetical protein
MRISTLSYLEQGPHAESDAQNGAKAHVSDAVHWPICHRLIASNG